MNGVFSAFGFSRRSVIAGGCALLAAPLANASERHEWEPISIDGTPPIVFTDDEGRVRSLSDCRTRPVLLNLWATWCAPCILELPALDRMQRDFGLDTLTILPLSVDRGGISVVREAYRRLKLRTLPMFVDSTGKAVSQLGAKGLPATFAISSKGEVLASRRGAVEWDDPDERKRVRDILGL